MSATAIQVSVLFLAVLRVAFPVFMLVVIGTWMDRKGSAGRDRTAIR